MKTVLGAITCLFLTLSLVAQSTGASTARTRAAVRPVALATVTPSERSDVNAALAELQRIIVATRSDISDLDIEQWKSGWRTAWLKNSSHKQQAEQVASSLQRNLGDAMPGLIQEVQSSRGSVSSTFKLYNDLSVVLESMDSLIEATKSYGRKGESGPLANDYAALGRLRQDLASYIQVTAAAFEPKGKPGSVSVASGPLPKKIIIDDNAPAKPAKKKTASLQ